MIFAMIDLWTLHKYLKAIHGIIDGSHLPHVADGLYSLYYASMYHTEGGFVSMLE